MNYTMKTGLPTSAVYHGWEMRAVKSGIGHDLNGWQGNLHKDGKKVCIVSDDGRGGCIDFYWEYAGKLKKVEGAEEAWSAFIAEERTRREADTENWTKYETEAGKVFFDGEVLSIELVNLAEAVMDTKKRCRRHIIIQCDKDINTKTYNTLPLKFRPQGWDKIEAGLKKQWKVNELRIVNAELGAC